MCWVCLLQKRFWGFWSHFACHLFVNEMSKDLSDRRLVWCTSECLNWCCAWDCFPLTCWLAVKALGQPNKNQHFVSLSVTVHAVARASAVCSWQLSSWVSNIYFVRNILIFYWKVFLFINLKATLVVSGILFFLQFLDYSLCLWLQIYSNVQQYKNAKYLDPVCWQKIKCIKYIRSWCNMPFTNMGAGNRENTFLCRVFFIFCTFWSVKSILKPTVKNLMILFSLARCWLWYTHLVGVQRQKMTSLYACNFLHLLTKGLGLPFGAETPQV